MEGEGVNLSPPMPELTGDVIRHRERIRQLAPPRPERTGDVIHAKFVASEIALGVSRHFHLRAMEWRDSRIPKPVEPEPIAPPAPARRAPLEIERMPQGAHPIEALAEGQIGLLALPTREVRGFWRWGASRGNRKKRLFYELAGGKELPIGYHDKPKFFWPARPLKAEPVEIVRPAAVDARPPAKEMPDELVAASSGEVTEAEVRNRVYWAVKTLQALPRDAHDKFLSMGNRVNWPAIRAEHADVKAQEENHDNKDSSLRKRRWRPSREHLRDMDEPLEWFIALGVDLTASERRRLVLAGELALSDAQWLVWWRARDKSYSQVAKHIGGNNEAARRRTDAVFERLTAIANEPARVEARRIRAAAVDPRAQAERQSEVSEIGAREPRGKARPNLDRRDRAMAVGAVAAVAYGDAAE
jgi:hypothetical protein